MSHSLVFHSHHHHDHYNKHTIAVILRVIRCLFLLDSAIVVDEHERAVVLGIGVSLGTFVARTQIAAGVVLGQSSLGGALLLSSITR